MADMMRRVRGDPAFTSKFQLGEKLGEGGMGAVFKATQLSLSRPVAVKFLFEGLAGDARHRQRFLAEARMAARLAHANIVAVYDSGEVEDCPYIVFELIDGRTLRETMDERQLTLREALELGAQVTDGLQAAHAQGIVHRDIKPENLLLPAKGPLKIADFGVAKDLLASGSATQPGLIVGTPLYLSPEQAEGLRATASSDLYALGLVLFEALTGQLPFEDDVPPGLLRRKLSERAPRADVVNPAIPTRIGALLDVALERDPRLRHPSAEAFGLELRRALSLPEVLQSNRPASSAARRRVPRGIGTTMARETGGSRQGGSAVVVGGPALQRPLAGSPAMLGLAALSVVGLLGAVAMAVLDRRPDPLAGKTALLAAKEKPLPGDLQPAVDAPTAGNLLLATPAASSPPLPALPPPDAPAPPPSRPSVAAPGSEDIEGPRARHDRESAIDWLQRVPDNLAALQAAMAEKAAVTKIESVLVPRQAHSVPVSLFLAFLGMRAAEPEKVGQSLDRVMELGVEELATRPAVAQIFADVSRWMADVSLMAASPEKPPAGRSGVDRELRQGRYLLGQARSEEASRLYFRLRAGGYPEASLALCSAIARLGIGDDLGAALEARIYLKHPGHEGTQACARFVLMAATARLGADHLSAIARKALESSPSLPPRALQLTLDWDGRMLEKPKQSTAAADEKELRRALPRSLESMSRDAWQAERLPMEAFDALAGEGASLLKFDDALAIRLRELLSLE